jgi:hypothetical protein
MHLAIDLSAIFFLVVTFMQDIKHRQISWWLIPVLAFIILLKALTIIAFKELLYFFIVNFAFFLTQLLLLTVYFSLKNKRYVNIINSYLGIGDILFIIVICMFFSPVNFIFFYIGSLMITLIGILIYKIIKKRKEEEIPLAGAMAFMLAIGLLFNNLYQPINFYNDQLFLSLFH